MTTWKEQAAERARQARAEVLAALRKAPQPLTGAELTTATGLPANDVRKALQGLRRTRRAEIVERSAISGYGAGKWAATTKKEAEG